MVQLLHLQITPDNQGLPMIIDNPVNCGCVVLNSVYIKTEDTVTDFTQDLYLRTNFMSCLSNLTTSNIPLLRTATSSSVWVPNVPVCLKQGIITRIDYDITDYEGKTVNLTNSDIISIDLLFSFRDRY